jgi:glycosyltransferase involved in cell wall biosynthesis
MVDHRHRPLTVILIHNRYVYRGGEDTVFEAEAELLEQHGFGVTRVEAQSRAPLNAVDALRLAASASWSQSWYNKIKKMARQIKPDLIHVHNFFPNISPAVLFAAEKANVPVVLTLHNFRLLCPLGYFFRSGRICEDCIGKTVPWPASLHGCYRQSHAASAAVSAMIVLHKFWGTWATRVSRYIALSEFSRNTLIRGGLPADRIVVKPNFARDLAHAQSQCSSRSGALFVGRLSREKGIDTLLRAWSELAVPLDIMGDGPLENMVREAHLPLVHWLGRKTQNEVAAAMRRAAFIVVPSSVYENFPMTIAEAFCNGAPVVTSRMGAMAELVQDGVTGLHFNPGDARDLADKVSWAAEHPTEMYQMGRNARRLYEEKYTPDANLHRLRAIYSEVVDFFPRHDSRPERSASPPGF